MHRNNAGSHLEAGKPRLLSKASSVAILEPLVTSTRDSDSVTESVEPFPADYKPTDTAQVTVDISLRRGRIALITIAAVLLIVAVVRFFTNGYEIRQYEKNDLDVAQQKSILDTYNSYSGNIVSAFSKPIELFVAACVQVIVLRFVSASLIRNEPSWKTMYGALALSGGVGYLINNGFNSLNVQLVELEIVSVVNPSDMLLAETVTVSSTEGASRVTNVSWSVSELQLRNPLTNTVLRNVVQSQALRSKSQCIIGSYSIFVKPIVLDTVEYGFAQRDWMKQLLSEALPAKSLRLVLNPTNKSANDGANSEDLPMNASIASNLVLSAMILSRDFIPLNGSLRDPLYNNTNSKPNPLKYNMSAAERVGLLPPDHQTASDTIQKKRFLGNVDAYLTAAFNETKNMTLTDIPVEFSHVDVVPGIVFDAVTLEVDIDPTLLADVTNKKTGTRYTNEGEGDTGTFYSSGFSCTPWPARCIFKKRDPEVYSYTVHNGGLYFDVPAQIQAFSICLNDNGTELMQTSGNSETPQFLNVEPCARTSTTSMLLLSVGKRILADALTENTTRHYDGYREVLSSAVASATNVRKIYSFTIGRLSWETTNIATEFGATCNVTTMNKCEGLTLELNKTRPEFTPQRLVISADALPMDALVPPELHNIKDNSFRQRPLTLVKVHEPTRQQGAEPWYDVAVGDVLLPHNIHNLTWDLSRPIRASTRPMCEAMEERMQRVLNNHMYIEHPLQTTYTAALFFLLQDAVVKDVVASNNQSALSKTMLNFDGNTQKVSLLVSIPSTNSLLTQIGCAVLLVAVAASILWGTIVRNSTSRPNKLVGIKNAEVLARAKLDERTFSSLLLHRHLTLVSDATGEIRKLDDYVINSLSLQHRDLTMERPSERPTEDVNYMTLSVCV